MWRLLVLSVFLLGCRAFKSPPVPLLEVPVADDIDELEIIPNSGYEQQPRVIRNRDQVIRFLEFVNSRTADGTSARGGVGSDEMDRYTVWAKRNGRPQALFRVNGTHIYAEPLSLWAPYYRRAPLSGDESRNLQNILAMGMMSGDDISTAAPMQSLNYPRQESFMPSRSGAAPLAGQPGYGPPQWPYTAGAQTPGAQIPGAQAPGTPPSGVPGQGYAQGYPSNAAGGQPTGSIPGGVAAPAGAVPPAGYASGGNGAPTGAAPGSYPMPPGTAPAAPPANGYPGFVPATASPGLPQPGRYR